MGQQMISAHKGSSGSNQNVYSQLSPHSQLALTQFSFHDFHSLCAKLDTLMGGMTY